MARPDSQAQAAGTEPLLLTVRELAAALAIGVRTLWRYDAAGKIPQGVSFGHVKRWRRREIEAWLEAGCPERREWEARYR